MKPYGVHRRDCGCCPGHDKFPRETYRNRRSKRAHTRDTKTAHRIERRNTRLATKAEGRREEE
jgi:hypothetical protein